MCLPAKYLALTRRALGRNTDRHAIWVAGGLVVGSNHDPDPVVVADILGTYPPDTLGGAGHGGNANFISSGSHAG